MGAIAAVAVNAVGVRDGASLIHLLGRAQPFAASLAAMVLYSAFIMVGHRQKISHWHRLGRGLHRRRRLGPAVDGARPCCCLVLLAIRAPKGVRPFR